MSGRDNRDTLLAFYGTYHESDPSVSEPPMPSSSAPADHPEVLHQSATATHSPTKSKTPAAPLSQDAPPSAAVHRQPSQYQPGSRAKGVAPNSQNSHINKPSEPSASAVPAALQPARPAPSAASASYTNPFQDPLPLRNYNASNDYTGKPSLPFTSTAAARPQRNNNNMNVPGSSYPSPPASGRPLLSVDPSARLQTPPRAVFAAPVSPAMSSTSTLIGSAPPSPAFAKSPAISDCPPSPSRDNDRFAPSERPNASDFWKRFSMVVKESENEKAGAGSADWLSKQKRKTRAYKRWIALVAVLIIALIVGIVCWQVLQPDGNEHTAPTEHDFGLGADSSSSSSASSHAARMVRRTVSPVPRALPPMSTGAFHFHRRHA